MAIARDSSSIIGSASSSSPITWSHTCTGQNLILIVGVEYSFSAASPTVTASATYNGVSMTQITYQNDPDSHAGEQLFYLINPTTGSNTVSVTFSVNTGTVTASGIGVSYTGAKQSGQPDSFGGSNGVQNPASASTTVVASNSWTIGLIGQGNATPSSYNAPTTLVKRGNIFGTFVDSNGIVSTGSQTLSINYANGAGSASAVASIAPAITANISDSISVGASRVATLSRSATFGRTMSDSVSNGAGRLATLARQLSRSLSLSDSISYGAGRLVTSFTQLVSWIKGTKHSSSWTDNNKDSSSFSTPNKSSSSWTDENKS